jgi:hypothetical protein
VENIALQSSQILYTFVLRVEITTTFGTKMVADMICQKVIYELLMSILNIFKKLINNSGAKHKEKS